MITKLKLLTDGGYRGLEAAVGKEFNATKMLGCWCIQSAELKAVGCTPCMKEYAFLPREVKIVWQPSV